MSLLEIFGQSVVQGPGTGSFTEHLVEIILLLLAAFLLGYWIGRIILGRYKDKVELLENENRALKAESKGFEDQKLEIETLNEKIRLLESKNSELRISAKTNSTGAQKDQFEITIANQTREIDSLKAEVESLKKEKSRLEAVPTVTEEVQKEKKPVPMKSASPSSETGDDLKKIEGIGPKIEQLLNADGIYSFQDMIDGGVDKIQAVLDKAGPLYKVHDPGTWTNQAILAAEGKWDELYQMQTELKGGKKV
ncbi:MAG: hypothetical protein JJ975_14715 [Bacteroidia bacterium]|nr:hypothetical protein [Bacteroidia bacterium]